MWCLWWSVLSVFGWFFLCSCALEKRGKNEGKMKGGQCLNTLCLRSGDSRTGIFRRCYRVELRELRGLGRSGLAIATRVLSGDWWSGHGEFLYLEFWQLGPVRLGVWGVPVCGSYSELGTETWRIVGRCQVLRMGVISVSISSWLVRTGCWHFWLHEGVSAKLQVFISQDLWRTGGSALALSYNSVS